MYIHTYTLRLTLLSNRPEHGRKCGFFSSHCLPYNQLLLLPSRKNFLKSSSEVSVERKRKSVERRERRKELLLSSSRTEMKINEFSHRQTQLPIPHTLLCCSFSLLGQTPSSKVKIETVDSRYIVFENGDDSRIRSSSIFGSKKPRLTSFRLAGRRLYFSNWTTNTITHLLNTHTCASLSPPRIRAFLLLYFTLKSCSYGRMHGIPEYLSRPAATVHVPSLADFRTYVSRYCGVNTFTSLYCMHLKCQSCLKCENEIEILFWEIPRDACLKCTTGRTGLHSTLYINAYILYIVHRYVCNAYSY
jgi:hypothetical protein